MTTPQSRQPSLTKKGTADLKNTFEKRWLEAVNNIPMPSWCESPKLAATLAHETEQYYIERRLDERIEKVKKTSKNRGEAFSNYSSAIDEYCEAMKSMFASELERIPVAFYRSDFPLSVLSRLDLLKHTQIKAYDFLKFWVNSFVGKANLYRGNWIKFDKVLVPFSEKSERIAGASNGADEACSRLLAYVRMWNASDYKDLLLDKPLTKNKLEPQVFDKLYLEFEVSLYSLQDTIRGLKPDSYLTPSASNSAFEMLGGILFAERFQ